jgi:branched-chain amino acid transport system permease protein
VLDALLQQFANGLSVGLGYALIALGLTLIFGVLHVINFGHGEIVMIGALAVLLAMVTLGLPYIAALPIAIVAGALVGWLTNRIAVEPLLQRAEGRTDVFLATFALGILFHETVLATWGRAPARVPGISGVFNLGPVSLTGHRLFVIGTVLATLVVLELLLKKTRFGVEMRAVAQSTFAARVVGIDLKAVNARTFILAAAVAGLGGGLLAPIMSFSPQIGDAALLKGFIIVVLAGLGSVSGAVACAVLVGVTEAMLGFFISPGMVNGVVSFLMLTFLLIRPQGIFSSAR